MYFKRGFIMSIYAKLCLIGLSLTIGGCTFVTLYHGAENVKESPVFSINSDNKTTDKVNTVTTATPSEPAENEPVQTE